MATHELNGFGPPQAPPTSIGQHYTDRTSRLRYISVGTETLDDWGEPLGQGDESGALAAHVAANDPHGDRASATAALASHAGASDPHGDRAAASAALAGHAGASDPHGDRAAAAVALASHAGGDDPHGDRAAASTALAAHASAADPHPQYQTAAEGAAAASQAVAVHAAANDPHGDRAAAVAALAAHLGATDPHGDRATAAAELTSHVEAADPHPQYTTATEVTAAIGAHSAASDPHGDRTAAAAALATHAGAADPHPQYTTAAEAAAAAGGAVDAHVGAADPHGDRAAATAALTAHAGASDPHGDRAAAAAALAAHAAAADPHPQYMVQAEADASIANALALHAAAADPHGDRAYALSLLDADLVQGLPTDASTNIATALEAHLLTRGSAVNNGVAVAVLKAGTYRLSWTPNVAALKAAGIRRVVLRGTHRDAVRIIHNADEYIVNWNATGLASAPLPVTAIDLVDYTPDGGVSPIARVHRLAIAGASTVFSKWSLISLVSQDRSPHNPTTSWTGETARVRAVDANYVYIDGVLEFADRLLTSVVARKLDDSISITIGDATFAPSGDVISSDPALRREMILLQGAVGARVVNCATDQQWLHFVRMNTCADSIVLGCTPERAVNRPATSGSAAVTASMITYGLLVYGQCFNCWMDNVSSIGLRHTFSTGGNDNAPTFSTSSWWSYGQPTWCGVKTGRANSSHGGSWDTHEQGSNIWLIDCFTAAEMGSDQASSSTQYIGAPFTVRARRTTIVNGNSGGGTVGVKWEVYDHGADNYLRLINTSIGNRRYPSDNSAGLRVSLGNGALTTRAKLFLEGFTVNEAGTSLAVDVAGIDVEGWGFRSVRPHLGHISVADGSTVRIVDTYWDSNSAAIPYASTANRTLFGAKLAGTSVVELIGLKHRLGSDPAKHTPSIFERAAAGAGKSISLVGYAEIDPNGIGARPLIKAGQEGDFTIMKRAAGFALGLQEAGGAVLSMGAVAEGQMMVRGSGNQIAGVALPAGQTIAKAFAADATFNNGSSWTDTLSFNVGANETWTLQAVLVGQCSVATQGVSFSITYPSGGVLLVQQLGNTSSNTAYNTGNRLVASGASSGTYWTQGATEDSVLMAGAFINGATPGAVTLRIRSNDLTNTVTIRAGSNLVAVKAST